jgi:CheY-like chemotaxis protein
MDLQMREQFFRLTSEGRSIWSARHKVRLPLDYRRLLGTVDYCGHGAVIRNLLGRFPTSHVENLLREFVEMRLIEPQQPPCVPVAELAREIAPPPVEPEDKLFFEDVLNLADISLGRLGVYLPYERIANRAQSVKTVAETLALVVEDDPDQLALAKRRLAHAGYRVAGADSVGGLLHYLEGTTPDAIFLDVNLPDGDGFQVLTRLRRHPLFAHLPMVMLTVKAQSSDIAKGLALAADGYVTKPYGPNTLDYVLRCLLKQAISRPSAVLA